MGNNRVSANVGVRWKREEPLAKLSESRVDQFSAIVINDNRANVMPRLQELHVLHAVTPGDFPIERGHVTVKGKKVVNGSKEVYRNGSDVIESEDYGITVASVKHTR